VSEGSGAADRGRVLPGLLRNPAVVVVALVSDGVIVPMPAGIDVPAERVLAAPGERTTLADLVVPADALAVVTTWERALAQGVALGSVRLRTDPDRPRTLTFVDARPEHGVLLGGLDLLADTAAGSPEVLQAFTVARRPRTATVVKNVFAVLTDVDERATRLLGWPREEMVGRRSTDFLHPDDAERAVAVWMQMLAGQDTQRVRVRHRRADGGWLWVELENAYRPAADPGDAVVVTQLTDISDEMAAHEALQQRERLLRRVAESLPVGILQLTPEGTAVYANSRLAGILGVGEVTGAGDLLAAVDRADRPALAAALTGALTGGLSGGLSGPGDAALEVTVPGRDRRVCAVSLLPLGDREGAPGGLVTVSDVTDSVRVREELTARATYDVLTGCLNRAATLAALDRALADGEPTSVLFVDLDDFKPVNDTLGHDAGDELLALAARRLGAALRQGDLVGRIGGDEFLVVSRGEGVPAAARAMGERVRAALTGPAVLAAGPVELRASIGVAVAVPGDDAAALVKRADRAMYRSKQDGRGRPVLAGELPDPA
jgi:diguanylate cyclase (GGDEF)-like protein/PAS domain S-box-containing protein